VQVVPSNAINEKIDALQEVLDSAGGSADTLFAIDLEWQTVACRNHVTKSDKVGVMQIACCLDETSRVPKVLILQLPRKSGVLPSRLIDFLGRSRLIGVNLKNDFSILEKDYGNFQKHSTLGKLIELGAFARDRDAVARDNVSLETLVEVVLKESMNKSNDIRCSNWSRSILSEEQIEYAAMDVIKVLHVHHLLQKLPDLSYRMNPRDATPGRMVDIVPPHQRNNRRMPLHGYVVGDLAARGGIGLIVRKTNLTYPQANITPSHASATIGETVVVKVQQVLAPALMIPGHKIDGKRACFSDFGDSDFEIILPLSMLRPHEETQDIRVYQPRITSPSPNRRITRPSMQQKETVPTLPATAALTLSIDSDSDNEEDDDVRVVDTLDDVAASLEDLLLEDDASGKALSSDASQERLIQHLNAIEESELRAELAANGSRDDLQVLFSEHLHDIPDDLSYAFSAVLGDTYHAIARCQIPIRHEYKKAYSVAMMQAFFVWDETQLNKVMKALADKTKMSTQDIDNLIYFKPRYFQQRVARVVPPSKQLYYRVRAVYATFGTKIDSKTKQPLFNDKAWSKANNVLLEIAKGYYSDPPFFNFYRYKIDRCGNIKRDEHGIPLILCSRGTNMVENLHKSYSTTFRFACGFELGNCMLAERRHRHNINQAERRLALYPRVGHFDPWLVDELQNLVESIHGKVLYPTWINASDFRGTDESFVTVAIHDKELHDALAMRAAELDLNTIHLSADKAFLCQQMGITLPFLPVHGPDEYRLFSKLLLTTEGKFNEYDIALTWTKYVDGKTVFPKIPAQLRSYFKHWERNQRVQSAARKMRNEIDTLAKIRSKLTITPKTGSQTAQSTQEKDRRLETFNFSFHHPIFPLNLATIAPIALQTLAPDMPSYPGHNPAHRKRGRPKNTTDQTERQKRRCTICCARGPATQAQSTLCPGRNNRKKCPWFES
jgi:hypothetical protein